MGWCAGLTWFTGALLIRFSRAAGLLAASPVMTPCPRRRTAGGATLLFLNLGTPPRDTPPTGKYEITDVRD